MSTPIECIYCVIKKADSMSCEYIADEEERLNFMKRVLREVSSYDNHVTGPFLTSKVMSILQEEVDIDDLFKDEKIEYNEKMLSIEGDIWKSIDSSRDKLLAGLKYAMVGNFIDFGAMDEIDDDKLNEIIDTALSQEIDMKVYREFRQELIEADRLCYLADNAGEIVFDKLFIRTIREINENIDIDIVVRGEPVLNDVTVEDAIEVGLDGYGNIIQNGTNIPGTDLREVNRQTIESIDASDLIISKGQGNFETLWGCGKNIYYIFLCKCHMFAKEFGMKKFDGVFMME